VADCSLFRQELQTLGEMAQAAQRSQPALPGVAQGLAQGANDLARARVRACALHLHDQGAMRQADDEGLRTHTAVANVAPASVAASSATGPSPQGAGWRQDLLQHPAVERAVAFVFDRNSAGHFLHGLLRATAYSLAIGGMAFLALVALVLVFSKPGLHAWMAPLVRWWKDLLPVTAVGGGGAGQGVASLAGSLAAVLVPVAATAPLALGVSLALQPEVDTSGFDGRLSLRPELSSESLSLKLAPQAVSFDTGTAATPTLKLKIETDVQPAPGTAKLAAVVDEAALERVMRRVMVGQGGSRGNPLTEQNPAQEQPEALKITVQPDPEWTPLIAAWASASASQAQALQAYAGEVNRLLVKNSADQQSTAAKLEQVNKGLETRVSSQGLADERP